jgi:thioredoxin reductase (NADPH)
MRRQAISFGCEIRGNASIAELELSGNVKSLTLTDGSLFTADVIILAPGGRSRTLGVPGEQEFKGKGISYCATCDGDFFTGKEIVVVGGGNSALEEAVSLTRYASRVTIIHQFDHFQAFEHAVAEALNHPQIDILMESAITAFHGGQSLESIDILKSKTGEQIRLQTDGAFIFIGYLPNTEFLAGKVDLNRRGEIIADRDLSTGIPGVYAAGDSVAKKFRQITTAVSDGSIAAMAATIYLNDLKVKQKQTVNGLLSERLITI